MEYALSKQDELYHFGVKGMKWGIRKQREPVGRQRRSTDSSYEQQKAARRAKAKRYAKTGAIIAGTVLAAYGGYKLSKTIGVKKSAELTTKELHNLGVPTIDIEMVNVPKTNIATTKISQIPSKYKYKKLSTKAVRYSKKKTKSTSTAPTVNSAIQKASSKPMSAASQWNKQLKENKLGYSAEQQALLEEIFKNMPK